MERPKFLSRAEREKLALQRLEEERETKKREQLKNEDHFRRFVSGEAAAERQRKEAEKKAAAIAEAERRRREENVDRSEQEGELRAIRMQYLGAAAVVGDELTPVAEKTKKLPNEKRRQFQFEWNSTDDTAREDTNPLYARRVPVASLFGRGFVGGVDPREQNERSSFMRALAQRRVQEMNQLDSLDPTLSLAQREARRREREAVFSRQFSGDASSSVQTSQLINDPYSARKRSRFEEQTQHWSEKALEVMTDRDWRIFREDFDIRIVGGRASLPLRQWHEAAFPEAIRRAIQDAGYLEPSPIQRQAIPIGLEGRDILAIAETGSGKTCAFLVPLLCHIMKLSPVFHERIAEQGPLAAILAPTRELAQQIDEECIKLSRHCQYRTACIVGGQSIEDQGFRLRSGVHIVIGTPGRMNDCLEHSYLVLNQCHYVVLDEADRMIDMGFEPQVVSLLEGMGGLLKSHQESSTSTATATSTASAPEELVRVTAMFSATMAPEVEVIAKKYLRSPVIVRIGDEDSGKNRRIEQRVFMISESAKKGRLLEELRRLESGDKVIIFVNEKKGADMLGRHLDSSRFPAAILHGGKTQEQREAALEQFRSPNGQILVATDVAGRGLDIPDVSHVINYDVPSKIAPYCHRIGRTGRAGKFGVAVSFVTEDDIEIMYDLRCYLEQTNTPVPPALMNHPAAQSATAAREEKSRPKPSGSYF